MPLFISALVGAFAAAMGSFIGRALIALGIGFVTYKGIDTGIGVLKQNVINSVSGLPGDIALFVGYLWLDKALTIVFSGVVVALSFRLANGSLKRMVAK